MDMLCGNAPAVFLQLVPTSVQSCFIKMENMNPLISTFTLHFILQALYKMWNAKCPWFTFCPVSLTMLKPLPVTKPIMAGGQCHPALENIGLMPYFCQHFYHHHLKNNVCHTPLYFKSASFQIMTPWPIGWCTENHKKLVASSSYGSTILSRWGAHKIALIH